MRRLWAVILMGNLGVVAFPSAALAGDPHAVQNRWLGVGVGTAAITLWEDFENA